MNFFLMKWFPDKYLYAPLLFFPIKLLDWKYTAKKSRNDKNWNLLARLRVRYSVIFVHFSSRFFHINFVLYIFTWFRLQVSVIYFYLSTQKILFYFFLYILHIKSNRIFIYSQVSHYVRWKKEVEMKIFCYIFSFFNVWI